MKEFENVVIGTGMGGAVLGYALAKAGQEVLFCEKGPNLFSDTSIIYNHFAEEIEAVDMEFEELKNTYRGYGRYADVIYANKKRLLPTLGSITGGSTALYGMVLERFFPCDFTSNLWPVSFKEMENYYEKAEALFRVRGEADPLKTEQVFRYISQDKIHPVNQTLLEHLKNKKLNPYILPKAFENIDGCQTCQSYLCSKNCKNDVKKICLDPAINNYKAQLMANLEVLRLEATRNHITSVIVKSDNKVFAIKAKRVFLAAGALNTPKILLNSRSDIWPQGLGNSSELVGKYLMRHLVDIYSLSLEKSLGTTKSLKEIGLNDFYLHQGVKLGNVQSFGSLPPDAAIIKDLYRKIKLNNKFMRPFMLKKLGPIIERKIGSFTNNSTLLAATLEDQPYLQNQMTINSEGEINIKYKIFSSEKQRLKVFRKILLDTFKEFHPQLLKMAHKTELLAHACGTCRFGEDPRKSVLNKYNRSHEIENLYIVDSSFFPTSGGSNPALTIAANSLRVADYICRGKDEFLRGHGS